MATLEQTRAQLAFQDINTIKTRTREEQKKYASVVHAMPTLLRSAGLCQSLHFVASRKPDIQRELLSHLSIQLCRVDVSIHDGESLLDKARTANVSLYLRLTSEAIACMSWYRRLVQGVLKIEAGDNDVSD